MTAKENLDMTPTEVAVMVGRSECTVKRWIASGRLQAIRVLGRVTIRRADVERLLQAVAVMPGRETA